MDFPSRSELNKKREMVSYQESLINDIKSVDVEKIDFSKGDFRPRMKVAEKQKVYFWIRLFLSEERNIKPDDTVKIRYTVSGEELETKFICYSKKGIDKDSQDEIVNYDTEDDRKVLCLMIDSDRINYNSEDIPVIRSLFKTSRFFDFQLMKREELLFLDSKGFPLDYFDVSF